MMKIERSTLDFLNDLRRNNYREWFHEQKPRYEAAKKNVLDVTAELIAGINEFDPALGFNDPRKSLFRIARDTRFTTTKEPYKTHFGVSFSPIGVARGELSAYYLHVDPAECFVACGIYSSIPEVVKAVREAIDDHWKAFSAILAEKAFHKEFGDLAREGKVLKRVPAGFDKESPAAEYLKLNQFYVYKDLPPSILTSDKLVPEVLRLYKLMQPLQAFLNEAVQKR